MILQKQPDEIEQMTHAGHLLVQAHQVVSRFLQPGVKTLTIAHAVREFLRDHQAEPVFETVNSTHPFPEACCISVNEEAVHGVPGHRQLQNGDLVSIDIGCRWAGWCADAAWTYPVGELASERQELLDFAAGLMQQVIGQLERQTHWSGVAHEVRTQVAASKFVLIEDVVGHGIGRELHEDPQVGFQKPIPGVTPDFELQPGMVFTVEPVLTRGCRFLEQTNNHGTQETEDGSDAVHLELTVALTEKRVEILTPLEILNFFQTDS